MVGGHGSNVSTKHTCVFRIQNAVEPEHSLLWLVILASLSAPLHGVLNAIVFGMDRETMQRLTPSQIKVSLWHEVVRHLREV